MIDLKKLERWWWGSNLAFWIRVLALSAFVTMVFFIVLGTLITLVIFLFGDYFWVAVPILLVFAAVTFFIASINQ